MDSSRVAGPLSQRSRLLIRLSLDVAWEIKGSASSSSLSLDTTSSSVLSSKENWSFWIFDSFSRSFCRIFQYTRRLNGDMPMDAHATLLLCWLNAFSQGILVILVISDFFKEQSFPRLCKIRFINKFALALRSRRLNSRKF
eukprot:Pompholyxophrys_punicea_v1_NODE_257_length_2508_cov_3.165919.p3 type:complete len:141 gc:universal NODE_257_length_2508_cov_3.165919:389-811(+)